MEIYAGKIIGSDHSKRRGHQYMVIKPMQNDAEETIWIVRRIHEGELLEKSGMHPDWMVSVSALEELAAIDIVLPEDAL